MNCEIQKEIDGQKKRQKQILFKASVEAFNEPLMCTFLSHDERKQVLVLRLLWQQGFSGLININDTI